MIVSYKLPLHVTSFALALVLVQSAQAQTTSPDDADAGGGEIIVTAERRATDLQKTAIAISAFTPELLEQRNITSVRDLAGQVPNLFVARTSISHTTQTFSLRGVGESDPIQEPVLAVYVDDVYVPRQIGSMSEFVDLERMELLRGPQGTLYGRNSSAGALRLITRDPDDTTHVTAEAGYGSYNDVQVRALVSGPIVKDVLSASVSYIHRTRDGVTYNPTLGHDVNRIDLDGWRGKLRFTGIDDLDAQLTVNVIRDRSDSRSYIPVNQPGGTFSRRRSYSEVEPLQHLNALNGSLRLIYTLSPQLSIKSITAAGGFNLNPVYYENDGEAALIQKNLIHYNDKFISQEVQLNGDLGDVSFTSGLFYLHERFFVERDGFSRTGTSATASVNKLRAHNITYTDAYAVFGEGTWKANDIFSLTAGIRGTIEKKRFVFDNKVIDNDRNVVSQSIAGEAEKTWKALTPKISVQAQWTPNLLNYLTWSRGFKSGGFDNRATRLDLATLPFNPEKVSTYEGGLKATLFGRALRSNLAVFYNDYKDLQVSFYDPAYVGSRRGNAGKAHSWGVELENDLRLSDRFSVQASGGYLKAVYDDYKGAGGNGVDADGNPLTNAPKYSLSGGATYDLPLGASGSHVRLSANAQYQSSFYSNALARPQDRVPSQTFVNGSVTWILPDDRFQLALTGKNILGANKPVSSTYIPSTGVYYKNYADPATVLISVRFAY
ncbi:TonB-dependent receptor [Sphingobium sp. YR768]|uniref:TonB-dependent receptor n=1 Tax=Sphingobium sp. YR768 TaxID=1884365 RepID=UPI0008C93004|nr:TonB-dependent receptor [Sphingobium sp. YR768]SEQ85264.1 iron complex outermembrane recepter protein [Sphingobium sp. YR768]